MFAHFRRSLSWKLLAAFLAVGIIPFVMMYLYIILFAQKRIVTETIKTELAALDAKVQRPARKLEHLHNELLFLSKLDVVDDVITKDLDRRLERLLTKKKRDMKERLDFLVLDEHFRYVVATRKRPKKGVYERKVLLRDALATGREYFLDGDRIVFFTPLFSSFDTHRFLGYMLLEYDLNNLQAMLQSDRDSYEYCLDPRHGIVISMVDAPKLIKPTDGRGHLITKKQLVVYERIPSPYISGFYYVHVLSKSRAFGFLHDFLRFLLLMLPIALTMLFIIGLYSSKRIVEPIKRLTREVTDITRTKRYDAKVEILGEDETGELAQAFNVLLETIEEALQQLETESRLRLERFVRLVEIFNSIIKSDSAKECIEVSLGEIRELTGSSEIYFSKEQKDGIPVYVSDFEKQKRLFYGTIVLPHSLDEQEERFYASVATMISLKLDRIRLIEKTMSASRAKSAFISGMSHEFRTPLNSILGYTQYLIAYGKLDEEQMEMVGNIESAAAYLLEMINGILDIAKIEAGGMTTHIERCDVTALLEESVQMIAPLAEQKGLQLKKEWPHSPLFIPTDAKLFTQIVLNLLSNAIKFSNEGEILLRAYTENGRLFVIVEDQGIGIAAEDLGKIFKEFVQLENSMQKKHKGTGLGLVLAKKLANILGGDIELASQGRGKGTKATLWLPL